MFVFLMHTFTYLVIIFNNVIVVHTDNETGAKTLADMFEAEFGIKPEIRIMGPIVGTHVGPNAVAITFLSNEERQHSSAQQE